MSLIFSNCSSQIRMFHRPKTQHDNHGTVSYLFPALMSSPLYFFFHFLRIPALHILSHDWFLLLKLWEAHLMSSHFFVFAARRLFQNLIQQKHQASKISPSKLRSWGPCQHSVALVATWTLRLTYRRPWVLDESPRVGFPNWSNWAMEPWSKTSGLGLILLDVGLRPDVIWFPIPGANREIRRIRNHQQTCTHQSPKEQTSEWWKMIETRTNIWMMENDWNQMKPTKKTIEILDSRLPACLSSTKGLRRKFTGTFHLCMGLPRETA